MDPPPMSTTTATTVVYNQNYQDSIESSSVSSPTSRQWDDTLPPPKLRMMCSYGGHIIPRPHDKSLCYMGGETRIVVADRHTSLADLCSRLSTTLLHGRHFSLKYQLPSEDLDSLVSVTTDEDLDNMIEEYDRLNASNPSAKPLRLRLFLFLSKPDTAASVGSLLDDAKSETWFVDALNGAGLLPRGLSDSANIDNLLEHKDGTVSEDRENSMELETQRRRLDVHLNLPDSPLVETNSSFGSSSSSPSMSNLPPIKVRVDQHMNQMAGLDEQLGQLNVNTSSAQQSVAPPLPLQPVQRKFGHDAYSLPSPESKHGGAYGLHSPDSIASDSSIASANCYSKPTFTQDQNPSSNRDTPTPPATTQIHPNTTNISTMNYQIPIQQIHDNADTPPPQQAQFIYTPPPQQMDQQQYPLYFLPVSQNHPYGMQMQPNPADTAPNPTTIPSSATTPPLYPTKNAIPMSTKPDMVPNPLYTTAAPGGMIQVPSNQFPQQYMNVSQMPHHPPTHLPTSNGGTYGYEYAHPTQDNAYYSQHHPVAAPLPSQYQSMTPASAMLLAQLSSAQQVAAPENAKQYSE
ncbi:Phox/Bem1p [Artemisia annua]|uniref:Phox/Bem1p n=1 Tax=Artemisia annua TaxID=35608 RepID=A0A2U1NSA5_ARTAN|nr:Phox/Bem1p [Artemisia annua]